MHWRKLTCNGTTLLNPAEVYKGPVKNRQPPKFGIREGFKERCYFEMVVDKPEYQDCNPLIIHDGGESRSFFFAKSWAGGGLTDECRIQMNNMKARNAYLKEEKKKASKAKEKEKRERILAERENAKRTKLENI